MLYDKDGDTLNFRLLKLNECSLLSNLILQDFDTPGRQKACWLLKKLKEK